MAAKTLKCDLLVLILLLFCPQISSAVEIPCAWTGIQRIVAVGDIHGDYDNFLTLLKGTHLVDDEVHWSAGKTHLVQIGDIMDRGTKAKDVLDLLMRLEKEAQTAGGMIHVLLGNHEELNITGKVFDYPDYVTVEQFVSFLPEDFRRQKEKKYLAGLPDDKKALVEARGLDPALDEDLQRFWHDLIRKDKNAQREYVRNFNKIYGKWLLQKNAVIKINDVVFSHAGISEKYSSWKLRDINDTLRSELRFFAQYAEDPYPLGKSIEPKIVYDTSGPLWYRGLATRDEALTEKEVTRTLEKLDASVMVTGHNFFQYGGRNPVRGIESVRHFNGRVYNIDTGINRLYHGLIAALIIDKGDFTLCAVNSDQRFDEVPSPEDQRAAASRQEMERYLKDAAVVQIGKSEVSGRTAPWKITLEERGISRAAIFKYINRPRPDPLPDSYKYELAAYELSKYLNLGFVPPVVERTIDSIPGSLQVFVENSISEWERKERNIQPTDVKAFTQGMDDLKVFQNLVLDSCENVQDILLDQKTWKIYQVDFSEAFAPKDETFSECVILHCSKKLYQKLLAWDQEKVKSSLAPYLNDEEIRALNARKNLILSTIRKLVAASGENAVLYQ
jgi:hypothetical protein